MVGKLEGSTSILRQEMVIAWPRVTTTKIKIFERSKINLMMNEIELGGICER